VLWLTLEKLHTEQLVCCCQACKEKFGHFDTQYEYIDCISRPHMLDATPDTFQTKSDAHHQQPCCDR